MKYHFQEKNKKRELWAGLTVFRFLQEQAMPGFPDMGMPAHTRGLAHLCKFHTLVAWLTPATPESATAA